MFVLSIYKRIVAEGSFGPLLAISEYSNNTGILVISITIVNIKPTMHNIEIIILLIVPSGSLCKKIINITSLLVHDSRSQIIEIKNKIKSIIMYVRRGVFRSLFRVA